MRRADRAVFVVAAVVAIAFQGAWSTAAHGKSLHQHLIDMVPSTNLTITFTDGTSLEIPNANDILGASTAMADAVQRLAIRGTDFPVASTVPGFSYVYDPNLQAFTKSKQLGPVFAERTGTVGKGSIEFGANYLFADLDKVDGRDFDLAVGAVQIPGIGTLAQGIKFDSFRLETHTINVYSTYGITDRWDVNVLLPLMESRLHVRGKVSYVLVDQTGQTFSSAPDKVRTDADAFGPGDLLIRTKYRLTDGDVSLAAALTLRLPTGNEANFQGLGDVTTTPLLIVEGPIGPLSIHGTAGFEINSDDLQRTRARYTLGGTYQVLDNLALLLDVLGSSSFVADSYTSKSFQFATGIDPGPEVPQSNIIDLATGVKVSMGEHALFYVGAIVPLTRDGLRADVIPTGGVEVGF